MGVTAGGVVGVKGEVGVRGEVGAVGVGVAGLRPLLYRGALCLNCDGSAGLGVLGSSGCRLASREEGARSRVRPGEGPAGQGPPRLLENVGRPCRQEPGAAPPVGVGTSREPRPGTAAKTGRQLSPLTQSMFPLIPSPKFWTEVLSPWQPSPLTNGDLLLLSGPGAKQVTTAGFSLSTVPARRVSLPQPVPTGLEEEVQDTCPGAQGSTMWWGALQVGAGARPRDACARQAAHAGEPVHGAPAAGSPGGVSELGT